MISHFLNLEWKQLFRSASFGKSIALKIIMLFFALYLVVTFLAIGVGGYFFLRKQFPGQDPLEIVNSYLLFAIFADLISRYLMQKLPVMNIQPLLILPIKKKKLVHYVLGKSAFSAFNIMSLFFYIPFSIVLIKEGYNTAGVLGWLFTMILIIQSANFLNFLINKNNKALIVIGTLLVGLVGLQKFGFVDVVGFGGQIFNFIYENPIYSLLGVIVLIVLYQLNYKQLRNQVYLDEAVATKVEEANTTDLSFINRLGSIAPFIKNDIRLIWRNKRTKMVFFMSFFFLFIGVIFFSVDAYKDKGFWLIYSSIFVTGGFTLNYGQFVPAWDSEHYRMLMTQSFSYRKFLESKWYLMTFMTIILFVLATPYLYFGLDKYLLITAGFFFNLGFSPLIMLYMGAYNKKRIELSSGGLTNTQGTSAAQFIVLIPIMLMPTLIYVLFDKFFGFNIAIVAIAMVGIISFLLKNQIINLIERKYLQKKYQTIHGFKQTE